MTTNTGLLSVTPAHRGAGSFLRLLAMLLVAVSSQADVVKLSVDFSVRTGAIRPLHGINKGPLVPGGILDVIKEQKELGIPFTRLHDCGWPNPFVVDHHAVFPDPDADPALPGSYDFRLTDEYIDAVRQTGAEPIYRLGESIEHTRVKRHVHPPADPEKWAAVCLGIIRHYNEGWADGFHHRIRYWEIWNEPENRPAMWSGTDDDYLRLYRTTAKAIKQRFPDLKVGGPALGASGRFVDGVFRPTDFAVDFLAMCRKDGVPLDFFSWHCYAAGSAELSDRARAIRRLLDSDGFTETESHLNEWNHLPGNDWGPISRSGTAMARQSTYATMAGAPGAAFVAAALIELQDAPVDVCNFFHGETGAFGIFTEHGVPLKVYQAFRAFHGLMETPVRVRTRGAVAGKIAFAGGLSTDGREATLLVSNFADTSTEVALDWKGFQWTGGVDAEIRTIDATHDFAEVVRQAIPDGSPVLRLALKAPAIAMVRLRPTEGAKAGMKLSVVSPADRLVFQRDLSGKASVPVAGTCAWAGAKVEARTIDIATSRSGDWIPVATVGADLVYRGNLTVAAGWYSLEVRARSEGLSAVAVVDRVGVGEVFVVVGHSVAHGGAIDLPGAQDDRVSTIALPSGDMGSRWKYKATGDPRYLPDVVGSHFSTGIQPAPAGNGTYFWAAFAEQIAKTRQVPVLVLNAAFGGSSLEHWARSARGEPFAHPFIDSSLGMPYLRLEHALTRYCAVTGLRAILSDQGQNDWPEKDEPKLFANYRAWIDRARKDTGFPDLAVVVNRRSPPGDAAQIRRVQERVIREVPRCVAGPDYDTLGVGDTVDKIHLSEAGARKAARLWADALDAEFFKAVVPMPPR